VRGALQEGKIGAAEQLDIRIAIDPVGRELNPVRRLQFTKKTQSK
jgi:hypothetical protein